MIITDVLYVNEEGNVKKKRNLPNMSHRDCRFQVLWILPLFLLEKELFFRI